MTDANAMRKLRMGCGERLACALCRVKLPALAERHRPATPPVSVAKPRGDAA